MIWLVEWGKVIVLHVRHAFWCNLWRSLPEDDVKFWRQRKPAAIIFHSLPFHKSHSCQINKSALHLLRITWQTCNNRKTVNPTQSSILMCCFRCWNRHRFLNSLLISGKKWDSEKNLEDIQCFLGILWDARYPWILLSLLCFTEFSDCFLAKVLKVAHLTLLLK